MCLVYFSWMFLRKRGSLNFLLMCCSCAASTSLYWSCCLSYSSMGIPRAADGGGTLGETQLWSHLLKTLCMYAPVFIGAVASTDIQHNLFPFLAKLCHTILSCHLNYKIKFQSGVSYTLKRAPCQQLRCTCAAIWADTGSTCCFISPISDLDASTLGGISFCYK